MLPDICFGLVVAKEVAAADSFELGVGVGVPIGATGRAGAGVGILFSAKSLFT